jgi:hypothetical protein
MSYSEENGQVVLRMSREITPAPWELNRQANGKHFIVGQDEALAEVFISCERDYKNAYVMMGSPDLLRSIEELIAWETEYRTINHLGAQPPHEFQQAIKLLNRLNEGDPNYTPYQVPEKKHDRK